MARLTPEVSELLLDTLRLVAFDCEREDIPTDADRVAYILANVRAVLARVKKESECPSA